MGDRDSKIEFVLAEPMLRPVLIVGPLADCVTEKLLTDFPDKFNRCIPEIRYTSQAVMENCLSDNVFIDYRKKGNAFECITIAALKESVNNVSDFGTMYINSSNGCIWDCVRFI